MTVTVDTSLDGQTAPAIVPDLQTGIQAAHAFAAQAAAAYQQCTISLAQCRDALAGANASADQASGVLSTILNNQSSLNAAIITLFLSGLTTTPPSASGVPWLDNGVVRVS